MRLAPAGGSCRGSGAPAGNLFRTRGMDGSILPSAAEPRTGGFCLEPGMSAGTNQDCAAMPHDTAGRTHIRIRASGLWAGRFAWSVWGAMLLIALALVHLYSVEAPFGDDWMVSVP